VHGVLHHRQLVDNELGGPASIITSCMALLILHAQVNAWLHQSGADGVATIEAVAPLNQSRVSFGQAGDDDEDADEVLKLGAGELLLMPTSQVRRFADPVSTPHATKIM
jgi:hypothetical protein